MAHSSYPPHARQTRFDPGRLVARLLCLVFGVLGALPLGAGFIARSEMAQEWVSKETAARLEALLGVEASYAVRINLLPLEIALEDLTVQADDGLGPAVQAERISITPGMFSLLDGKIDIGNIEIDRATQRLVIEDGKITNLTYQLPTAPESDDDVPKAPFRALSASDTRLDLTIDGTHVQTGPIDVDVFAEDGGGFEIALRMGESRIKYAPRSFAWEKPPETKRGKPVTDPVELFWDEDVICQLDARVRVGDDHVLVRRLVLTAGVDIDPTSGTEPGCPVVQESPVEPSEQAPDFVSLRSTQLRVVLGPQRAWAVEGSVEGQFPVDLLNRATANNPTFHGNITLVGDLDFNSNMRMPEFTGRFETGEFMLAGRRLVEFSKAEVELADDQIKVPRLTAQYAGGPVEVEDVVIEPFEPGIPLRSKRVLGTDVSFSGMIRDLDITPNTIVQWHLDRVHVANFGGTLDPPKLDGDLQVDTSQFELFNKAHHSPTRKHMIGVKPRASLRGRFAVRNDSVQFNDMDIRFGKSHMHTTVHLGFDSWILVDLPTTSIDLAEISPLVTVPLQGTLNLSAKMDGEMENPTLKANMEIVDLVFAGYPLGDLRAEHTTFRPLWLEIERGVLRKGKSTFRIPKARLDFDKQASIEADLLVSTAGADVRDFLQMWHFDQDDTWKDLEGSLTTNSRVRFVMDGPGDPCGEGNLRVNGNAKFKNLGLFGENYDAGDVDYDFGWRDVQASYHGMELDLSNVHLEKGLGSIIGSLNITEGAKLRGNLVATAIPIDKLQGAGDMGKVLTGTVSAMAQVSGSLDQLDSKIRATVSPVMLGRSRLPASKLEIHLEPTASDVQFAAAPSRCGNRIPLKPDAAAKASDKAQGIYHIAGHLFGQQVMFDKFSITRQTKKIAKGGVLFNDLNLGPLLELHPEVGLAKQRPAGKLSGRVDLARMPLDHWASTQAVADIGTFWMSWKGFRLSTEPVEGLTLAGGALTAPKLTLKVATPNGREATFDVTGEVENVTSDPRLDVEVALKPVELRNWAMLLPDVSRVSGKFGGFVKLTGPLTKPKQSGKLSLSGGQFVLKRNKLAFDEVDVDVALNENGIVLERAFASVGGGTVEARGGAPIQALSLGDFRGQIQIRGVSLPVTDGVELAVDADLETTWQRNSQPDQPAPLPTLTGFVTVKDFEYSRPVTMNADITSLARKGKRTQFESYDPSKDFVELDVTVRSSQALRLNNNLMDANLRIEPPGLQLTGTNQRFGMRGTMRVEPGGRIRLRRNEFEVQSGEVRFDDATTIAPRVDLRAVTEYRRYSGGATSAPAATGSTASAATGSTSGQWRIAMHAHGDAENLKIDLTSQPKLSQDDIFLLLTVGLTRAELDQAQSASLGESVALEALGSLTGADSAVTEAIPVIDEFRFGSSYSSRTGRTEPTVTVGKRLTERIRAFVTSGISESREVRSNLEWRLNRQVSVEGSYDNVNDISSSNLGNLGADVRWRLEFR